MIKPSATTILTASAIALFSLTSCKYVSPVKNTFDVGEFCSTYVHKPFAEKDLSCVFMYAKADTLCSDSTKLELKIDFSKGYYDPDTCWYTLDYSRKAHQISDCYKTCR